jgi:hypothetical protein
VNIAFRKHDYRKLSDFFENWIWFIEKIGVHLRAKSLIVNLKRKISHDKGRNRK